MRKYNYYKGLYIKKSWEGEGIKFVFGRKYYLNWDINIEVEFRGYKLGGGVINLEVRGSLIF